MSTRKKSTLLWIAQGLLAALFLFAGGFKLVAPAEMLRGPIPLPIGFLRFIGAAEFIGAVGLLLPGIVRIHRELTPIAAVGLACIMSGATTITIAGGMGVTAAVMPFVAGVLASTVVVGRASWVRV